MPRSNAQVFDRLRHQVKQLVRGLSALEELADRVENDLATLTGAPLGVAHRKVVNPVATALTATPLADGACLVGIDGSDPVVLPPRLWNLLFILADEATGTSSDVCVGWKHEGDVRIRLGKTTGQAVSAHALSNLVWRLRKALGMNKEALVQTRKAEGLMRFALRRNASTQVVIQV